MPSLFLRIVAISLVMFAGCPAPSKPPRVSPGDIGLDVETLAGRELVVLKFGAQWCPPCRTVDESLDQLKQTHGASVVVKKIDIGEQPQLAAQFGVSGIPRIFLLQKGDVLDDIVGSRSHADLAKWVEGVGATPGPSPLAQPQINPLGSGQPPGITPVNLTPRNEPTSDTPQGIRSNPFATT